MDCLGLCNLLPGRSLLVNWVRDYRCPVQVPEHKRPVLGCKCPQDQKRLWVQVCGCLPKRWLALLLQHLRRLQTRCLRFPVRLLRSSLTPKHWRVADFLHRSRRSSTRRPKNFALCNRPTQTCSVNDWSKHKG